MMNWRSVGKGKVKSSIPELQLAISNNDLESVKILLASKADPNEIPKGNHTALHVAASTGNLQGLP